MEKRNVKFDLRNITIAALVALLFAAAANAEYFYPPNGQFLPVQPTDGTNSATCTAAGALKVDGSAVTQPVSGSITATVSGGTMKLLDTGGANQASVSAGGALKVDNSAVTQPVSGTFWQATQPVSGTFYQATQPVSIAGTLTVNGSGVTQPVSGTFWQATQPVSGTFWQATQPVSGTVAATESGTWNITNVSGTVSLPTGAATAAKQPALGVAGTAASDVITVQGIASMTALKVDGSAVTQPVSATTTAPLNVQTNGRATYAAVSAATTPAATATDIFTIAGSGTKTIRVLRIVLSSTQTTAGINKFFVIKRSALDTTGTATTLTNIPLDSGDAAATAVVKAYTANPGGLGAAVGTIRLSAVESPATTSVITSADSVIWDELQFGKGVVLRGTAENLAVNFGGAAVPTGLAVTASVYFTEE